MVNGQLLSDKKFKLQSNSTSVRLDRIEFKIQLWKFKEINLNKKTMKNLDRDFTINPFKNKLWQRWNMMQNYDQIFSFDFRLFFNFWFQAFKIINAEVV